MISKVDVARWFKLPVLFNERRDRASAIYDSGRSLADVILDQTRPGREQEAAILKVREAVMLAASSIAGEEPA